MSRGASARLFAALDPPAEVGEELLRWARGALLAGSGIRPKAVSTGSAGGERAPRLLAPASLHITLMFLGERPFEEIEALAEALGAAAERGRACELWTGAPVWLPPRRPRALAVEVHEREGDLAALQRDLAGALCEVAGLQPPRRFRAHLTVARARSGARAEDLLAPTPALRFPAEEVVLYRSYLEQRGARYERLAAAPLMG